MKLRSHSADIAQLISAFVCKGGWLTAPLGGAALLYLMQDKLVFNPVRTVPVVHRASTNHKTRAVTLTMQDGTALRGWLLRPSQPAPLRAPALLYFGGRSEEVSWVSQQFAQLCGFHSLFVNYRGYGDSQGQPSEGKLLADGLELFDWLSQQPGVDPARVSVIGRSLGTGVAAYVAAHRPVAAAVLITPYDSMVELARHRFPYCAAQLLLKHRFESVRFASLTRAPALILLAQNDDVVPQDHAVRFINAWAGMKRIKTIKGSGHCDIQANPASWNAIRRFLLDRNTANARQQRAEAMKLTEVA